MIEFDGIQIRGFEVTVWPRKCHLLRFKANPTFSLSGGFGYIQEVNYITIYIYNKLGIDLTTKENIRKALSDENKRKVVYVWNGLHDEFSDEAGNLTNEDYGKIVEILKDKNSNIKKYIKQAVENSENSTNETNSDSNENSENSTNETNSDSNENSENSTNETNSDSNTHVFVGNSKQIVLNEDQLTIGPREGKIGTFMSLIGTTKNDVFYTDIRSVVVQQPNLGEALFGGGGITSVANSLPYIRIFIKGIENHRNFKPVDDPYTVIFDGDQKEEADKFKSMIDKLVSKHRSGNNNQTVVNQLSTADELEKFANLLDKGIITQEEFDKKKKELLGL